MTANPTQIVDGVRQPYTHDPRDRSVEIGSGVTFVAKGDRHRHWVFLQNIATGARLMYVNITGGQPGANTLGTIVLNQYETYEGPWTGAIHVAGTAGDKLTCITRPM